MSDSYLLIVILLHRSNSLSFSIYCRKQIWQWLDLQSHQRGKRS